jgi:hypothetical protein
LRNVGTMEWGKVPEAGAAEKLHLRSNMKRARGRAPPRRQPNAVSSISHPENPGTLEPSTKCQGTRFLAFRLAQAEFESEPIIIRGLNIETKDSLLTIFYLN